MLISIQTSHVLEAGAFSPEDLSVQIIAVEAIPYSVPYRWPQQFASGSIQHADNVVVRVHTDEGLVGEAEAQPRPYTYGETQASIVEAIRNRLSPTLSGLDPIATELAHERCAQLAGNHVARGAVDLAIWDLAGKALGCSCRALLGGYASEIEVAYMIGFEDPRVMAERAVEIHERFGVRTFKVKVGREVIVDVAACRAIRNALPDAQIYADANRGWTYEQARRAGEALAELGVLAIEEPIAADDRDARLRLAERLAMPIIGDESCLSLTDTVRTLDDGAVRTVSVKTARTGFTESRRILDYCLGRHVPIIVGSQYETAIGALATATFASAFAHSARRPAELLNAVDLADDLLVTPIRVREGRFCVPDTPGVGVALDEEKLAHYRLEDRMILTAA